MVKYLADGQLFTQAALLIFFATAAWARVITTYFFSHDYRHIERLLVCYNSLWLIKLVQFNNGGLNCMNAFEQLFFVHFAQQESFLPGRAGRWRQNQLVVHSVILTNLVRQHRA